MTIDSHSPSQLVRRDDVDLANMSDETFGALFRPVSTGLHVDRNTILTARERVVSIASSAQGGPVVVAGTAATIMHGSLWYDHDFAVELIRPPTSSGRCPVKGAVTHRTALKDEEIVVIDGILVTSPLRTAFDIGRRGPRWRALGYLDALCRATEFDPLELVRMADDRSRCRNIRLLRELARRVNGLSESPPESWIGDIAFVYQLPTPERQIEVFAPDGRLIARIDLGYRALKIGIEYDGEEFHSTPLQLASDSGRDSELGELGWKMLRFRKSSFRNPVTIAVEIDNALKARGGY